MQVARKEALEKGVMDILEWKGRYMIPLDTHPNIMRTKMLEFGNAIDVKYLINHPDRIKDMMEIVEHFSDYIIKNETKMKSLKPDELRAFRNDFMEVWNGYGKLIQNRTFLSPMEQKMAGGLKE